MTAARSDGEDGVEQARVAAALRWVERDLEGALHAVDRAVVHAAEAARWLVLEHLAPAAPPRDLYSACARLGRLMAEAGASPSLAAGAIDGAVRALDDAGAPLDPSRLTAARASLLEGYVAAVRDAERAAARASWEWPACAAPLGDGVVAIACGFPSDDREELAGWAARVAGELVRSKIRRVLLSGAEPARTEIANAVALVGIAIDSERLDASTPKRWLRWPWRT